MGEGVGTDRDSSGVGGVRSAVSGAGLGAEGESDAVCTGRRGAVMDGMRWGGGMYCLHERKWIYLNRTSTSKSYVNTSPDNNANVTISYPFTSPHCTIPRPDIPPSITHRAPFPPSLHLPRPPHFETLAPHVIHLAEPPSAQTRLSHQPRLYRRESPSPLSQSHVCLLPANHHALPYPRLDNLESA